MTASERLTAWSSLSRRELLSRYGGGLGGIALLSVLAEDRLLAGDALEAAPLCVEPSDRTRSVGGGVRQMRREPISTALPPSTIRTTKPLTITVATPSR